MVTRQLFDGLTAIEYADREWAKIDGPAYADRVKGRLTFRDWESWEPKDQAKYRDRYKASRT